MKDRGLKCEARGEWRQEIVLSWGHILSERGVKNRVRRIRCQGGRLGEAEKEKSSRIKRQGERKEEKGNEEQDRRRKRQGERKEEKETRRKKGGERDKEKASRRKRQGERKEEKGNEEQDRRKRGEEAKEEKKRAERDKEKDRGERIGERHMRRVKKSRVTLLFYTFLLNPSWSKKMTIFLI